MRTATSRIADWASLDAADADYFWLTYLYGYGLLAVQEICGCHFLSVGFLAPGKTKLRAVSRFQLTPSGDKLSTIQYFITLAMQQGMVWVGKPSMKMTGTINRIGSNSGLMAQVGATSPADIPQGDLDTAKAYGERVAHVAAKLRG
jgi:multimeric flavodoxin WrbA